MNLSDRHEEVSFAFKLVPLTHISPAGRRKGRNKDGCTSAIGMFLFYIMYILPRHTQPNIAKPSVLVTRNNKGDRPVNFSGRTEMLQAHKNVPILIYEVLWWAGLQTEKNKYGRNKKQPVIFVKYFYICIGLVI